MKHLKRWALFLLVLSSVTPAYAYQLVSMAPNGTGITFQQGLTWDEVKTKAKSENKYIFVDAYATWCGPCHAMDKNVYSSEKVGDFFNDKFISVRMQVDKTDGDSEEVRKWYAVAAAMDKQYKMAGFPTYLFFSPDGEIVHRDLGEKKIDELVDLAHDALDPSKQFYTLLRNYQRGRKDYVAMPYLAVTTLALGDKETANAIVADYKANYFRTLSDEEICKKEILWFISQFETQFLYPEGSNGKLFGLLYRNPDEVDKAAAYTGFADKLVRAVIRKEEIDDKVWKGDKPVTTSPDWEKISVDIRTKYSAVYADTLVPIARRNFNKRIGNWREFARLRDEDIKEHPPAAGKGLFAPDGTWLLNTDAWDVFQHCADKKILAIALKWVDLSIKLDLANPNEQVLDTRANLLYKLGRVREAITQERKAINLDLAEAKKAGLEKGGAFDDFTATILKMKKSEPTWPNP